MATVQKVEESAWYQLRPMTPEWRAKFEAFADDAGAGFAAVEQGLRERHPDIYRELHDNVPDSLSGVKCVRAWLERGQYPVDK